MTPAGTRRRSARRAVLLGALGLLALASTAVTVAPTLFGRGLVGRFYSETERSGTPRLVRVGEPSSPDWVSEARSRFGTRPFSAEWHGWLLVDRRADHVFATISDDGSWLYVDGRLVVDNGGDHGSQVRQGSIALDPGLHEIRIDYFQRAGGARLEVRWAAGDGPQAPLTPHVLFPTKVAHLANTTLQPGYLLPLVWSVGLLALVAARLWLRVRAHLQQHPGERVANAALLALLAAAFVLFATGAWWGLPASWEHDELRPPEVLDALDQWFSSGWHDHYPPLYFAVLGLLSLPFKAGAAWGATDLWSTQTVTTLVALYRIASLLASLALVYLTYLTGREVFGHRAAGLWAGLFVACIPNVVFYAKISKPDPFYIAWFALALLYYLRALRIGSRAHYVRFALAATLAVCTKDQACGLFVFPTLHLVWARWRLVSGGPGRRAAALVRDPALRWSLVVAAVTFVIAHNLLFNLAGFFRHLDLITGGGSTPFRMYERSWSGHATMLLDAVRQVPWGLGWPGALLAAAGFVQVWRRNRETAVALLLPAASYYACFTMVIMFLYDRFYVAPLVPAAVMAGGALSALIGDGARVTWRALAAAAVVGYTVLYGVSVDMLMLSDSRIRAEAWLREHSSHDTLVGLVGPAAYLPRPGSLPSEFLEPAWDIVEIFEPDFLVINAEYGQRWTARPDRPAADFLRRLQSERDGGYRLAATFKSPPGLAVLGYDSVFTNGREDVFTNLDKINPVIRIYARAGRAAPPSP